MTRKSLAVAGVAFVLAGILLDQVAFRGSPEVPGPDGLAAEIARLRSTVEAQAERIARLEESRGPAGKPSRDRPSGGKPAPGSALRAESPVLESALSGSLERGRRVLADLEANTDGTREVAIREALQELVRVGDPIVPDIVAALDSGLERRYVEGKPLLQHVKGYVGLRQVLIGGLREIGTPAARQALFEAVGRSRSVSDFRDLTYPNFSTTDPVLVEGISALVPEMLRSLAREKPGDRDGTADDLGCFLDSWIRRRRMVEAVGPLEDLLMGLPSDLEDSVRFRYGRLFGLLVEFAPEKAVPVLVALLEKHPKPGVLWEFSHDLEFQVTRAQLARYYGLLLSRGDLGADVRIAIYQSIPDQPYFEIKDPAARAGDAEALVAVLEGRLEAETEGRLKDLIRGKIQELRKHVQETRK